MSSRHCHLLIWIASLSAVQFVFNSSFAESRGYEGSRCKVADVLRGLLQENAPDIRTVDVEAEHFANAFSTTADGEKTYYGARLTGFDERMQSVASDRVKLPEGRNITGRDYPNYLKRLHLTEEEVQKARGESWLSVGEGESNFTYQLRARGINGIALDASVINPYAPEATVLAYAQKLPFADEIFDRTNSVWLVQHFFRPTAGSSMFNPPAGRQAILEMIRVTKRGGQIRINPILHDSAPILDFLEHLKSKGIIEYETTPLVSAVTEGGKRALENADQYTSVLITRRGSASIGANPPFAPSAAARSESLAKYGLFPRESVTPSHLSGRKILEFGDDRRFVDELKSHDIDARLFDYKLENSKFATGLPDSSIDDIFNLSGGLDDWNSVSYLDPILTEIARVLKPGGKAHISSIEWPSLGQALEKHPNLEVVRRESKPRTGRYYVELRRKADRH